jgi:hypothetical protein
MYHYVELAGDYALIVKLRSRYLSSEKKFPFEVGKKIYDVY